MKFDPTKLVHLTSPSYSSGKMLTVDDLRAEQEYQRQSQWQHNRMLHGYGIVAGLEVLVEENEESGARITVAPGYGLDGWGRELIVTEPLTLKLPRERRDLILYLKYLEDDVDKTNRLSTPASTTESVVLLLEPPPAERALAPTARRDFGIPLTRLRRPHLTWQRDRAFRPPRARP